MIENIKYCYECRSVSKEENCPECNGELRVIGFIENAPVLELKEHGENHEG